MSQAPRVIVNGATSGDKVTILISRVPQGSILSQVLFNVLVDNLEAGFKSILSKLADHTKLGGPVDFLKRGIAQGS